MMRVIAGTARGKNLAALPGEDVTRPTINRVKEAMFSSVQFSVPGARVLDLFAGSGQLGIEALSRGAKRCVFLDASREAIQIVLANCKTAGVFAQSRVIPDDAFHFLATTQEEFDLALLDPPYHHGTVAKALPQLAAHMAPGGVVLCETELDAELPQADLVALSLPGTPETLNMFDAARLARCKQGAILLNVGRGSTVDCLALADAVHSGHLFGAALDVTDPEPLPSDHPLWSEPNVIITPHISGRFSLAKTLDNIVEIFIHNLKLYAAGQPVDNQVSRTTHYVSGGSGGQRLVCGMP